MFEFDELRVLSETSEGCEILTRLGIFRTTSGGFGSVIVEINEVLSEEVSEEMVS